MVICLASNISVFLPASALTSSSLPTRTNLPALTANAALLGRESIVYIFALKTTRSGSFPSRNGSALSDRPLTTLAMPAAITLMNSLRLWSRFIARHLQFSSILIDVDERRDFLPPHEVGITGDDIGKCQLTFFALS